MNTFGVVKTCWCVQRSRGARHVWVPVEHAVLQNNETARHAEWTIALMRTSDGGPSCAVYTPAADMMGTRYDEVTVTDAAARMAGATKLPAYREPRYNEYPNEDQLTIRG